MAIRTEQGYLVLADFSGYTSFMAKAELDHAQPIARELLELLSSRLSPLLTLLEVEGDALFVFAPAERIRRGETLLELIESTYVAFRDRLGAIRRHTSCGCVACNSVETLDLKFFVHFGEYVSQKIAGVFKLIGSDVNLLHRLTKNHIAETPGWKGYALFTGAALTGLQLPPAEMYTSTESYEHLGDVVVYVVDLHRRHQELTEARRVFISAAGADAVRTRNFACAPPVLWEWLNDPLKRNRWMKGTQWTALARPHGRTGPGASNHCAHGKGVSIEHIVDWRPFEYFSTEVHEGLITISDTVILTSAPIGTHLSHHVCLRPRLPKFLLRPIAWLVVSRVMDIEGCWDRIERLISEEMEERSS
jgi:hypothetical protein